MNAFNTQLTNQGSGIRARVTRAIQAFRQSPTNPAGPAPGADDSTAKRILSQSSAPPLDLAQLWAQDNDRQATYRDADLMDAESDLCSAALNAWAATATAGSLFGPQLGMPDPQHPSADPPSKADARAKKKAAKADAVAKARKGETEELLAILAEEALHEQPAGQETTPTGGALGVSNVYGVPMQAGGGLLSVIVLSTDGKSLHAPAQEVADQVFADCHLAERAWTIARDTRKYGDKFMEIVVDDGLKIRRLKSLPPGEIIREEDEFGRLAPIAFRQQRDTHLVAQFASWQIVHLRNNRQGDEKYGRSGVRTARRVWRMLSLLEDSLVSARLSRAYCKLVHFLPVTDGATQEERQQMVQDYIRAMTTTTLIDPTTGNLETRQNPVTVNTDYFLTISPSDSQKTGVQMLDPANEQLSNIPDMEYFQNLLCAGLEVPKAYLGLERDVNSKATLTYQEIHFLRQAGSLQNTVSEGVKTVLDLGFTLAGIDPAETELKFLYGA